MATCRVASGKRRGPSPADFRESVSIDAFAVHRRLDE
jgi:hypothetical protein